MKEEETRSCPNCKREIPATNFTIHTVHCARNIKVCPVCKEPVLSAELDDHHKKLHKLLPCKQCGESVCGTDLEDHIRDSCANTIKTCRFCELELPRREIPNHESYCGVRTEKCPECHEYVMIKYRQLHLDSNHGFIRLDDDPAPDKIVPVGRGLANVRPPPRGNNSVLGERINYPWLHSANSANPIPNQPIRPTSTFNEAGPSNNHNGFLHNLAENVSDNSAHVSAKVANNSLNVANNSANMANNSANLANNSANMANHSANAITSANEDRPVSNGVKKRTNDQPQINTNVGATKKVDKDLAISKGAVKKRPAPAPPAPNPRRDIPYYSAMSRRQNEDRQRMEQNMYNLAHGLPPVLTPLEKIEKLRKMDALHNRETEEYVSRPPRASDAERRRDEPRRVEPTRDETRQLGTKRDEFKDLKPMSPEQFVERVRALQLQPAPGAEPDRFSEIKTSLRELRRGLNEVTAPYNNNVTANNNDQRGAEVMLPCEFCDELMPPDDLVLHQTGCRPDLARLSGRPGPGPARAHSPPPANEPVIPCEFCAQPLPYYLLTEHQERCAREVDVLSD